MAEAEATPGVALERSGAAVVAALRASAEKAAAGSAMLKIEQHRQWPLLSRLPMKLEVTVPVPGFKVRNLLALNVGQMILSVWRSSEDVPLRVGGVQLAWSEFEVVEQRMAVRLTRLA